MQGKVKEIRRTTGSQKPDLVFNYDGLGNRVSKTVIPKTNVNSEDSITTYYVRDAQGNILATYEKTKYKNGDEKFYLKEQYLYGSSRIGMKVSNQLLASNVNGNVEIKEYDGYFTKEIGNKRYELTNHLGNVLAVVSDKKLPDNEPDVISVTDYYPFGMQMPGRLYSEPSNGYRFGFGSHEKDDEVSGNGNHLSFGDYGYNPRLGRRWRLDPVDQVNISNYATFRNNPMIFVDVDGNFSIPMHTEMVSKAFSKTTTSAEIRKLVIIGTSVYADAISKRDLHLDNKPNFKAVASGYFQGKYDYIKGIKNEDYGLAGEGLHTIADFYSHSNYIPLYKEYVESNPDKKLSTDINDIPTFTEAMKNPDLKEFQDILKNELKTGTFGEGNVATEYVKDKFSKDEDSHGQMNLDSNSSPAGKQLYNDNNTMHDAAKATAQKDLDQTVK